MQRGRDRERHGRADHHEGSPRGAGEPEDYFDYHEMYVVFRTNAIEGIYNIDTLGLPVVSFLLPRALGDKRDDIAQASESFVSEAPLSIIIVLDIQATNQWDDLSDESQRWMWYYEAGAAAHNILLQATSRGLAGNIVSIQDKSAICSALKLNEQDFDPMLIVPVG